MIALKWSAFPMPFWFSPRFNGFAEGEVISDNQVKVGNEIFTLESGVMPEIGTKLRVSPNRHIYLLKQMKSILRRKNYSKKKEKKELNKNMK